jgi:hypothetical protein
MFKIVGGFSKQQFLKLFIEVAGTYSAAMLVIMGINYFSYNLLDMFFWLILILAAIFCVMIFISAKQGITQKGAEESYYPMSIFIGTSILAILSCYEYIQVSQILIAGIGYLAAITWFWVHVEKMTVTWDESIRQQHNFE